MNKFTLKLVAIVAISLLLGFIFREILAYIIISVIVATLLKPLVNALSNQMLFRVHLPRALAIVVSFAFLGAIATLFVLTFIPLVATQIKLISQIQWDEILYSLDNPIREVESFLLRNKLVHEKRGFLRNAIQVNNFIKVEKLQVAGLVNWVLNVLTNFSVTVLAVTFISFFILYEQGILKRNFLRLIPNGYFELTVVAFYKIEKLLRNYLLGLTLQMFSIFTFMALGLTLLGVNYALTVALFMAAINIIPYLGPLIGGAFGIFVALTTSPLTYTQEMYTVLVLKIIALEAVVHVFDNLVTQPVIFSKSVKAHPLEIFVAIFAGAAVGDVLGMIAAIPVYTVIRVSAVELYKGYGAYRVFSKDNKILSNTPV